MKVGQAPHSSSGAGRSCAEGPERSSEFNRIFQTLNAAARWSDPSKLYSSAVILGCVTRLRMQAALFAPDGEDGSHEEMP